MSANRTELLLCLAAYLMLSSSGFAQTGIPLPPDSEQLAAWKVSHPEWFDRWETAEMRCNIDDPTQYAVVRLDHDADPYMDSRSANKQIEDLDRRIVRHLKKHGWSEMKFGAGSGMPALNRCFQKNDSIVQIYKVAGRCTANSPCTVYDGLALTFYLPETPPGQP
jgi:hypothetical protein